jgi:conjugal transfer/type IV secretion protein DotA/TraY
MAIIYASVRLLPPNHPYLNAANIGQFTVRHVFAEAANNLVFSRKNIDQIIVFVAMMAGFVVLVMQFALLIVSVAVNHAFAGVNTAAAVPAFTGIFATTQPAQDVAFMLMDSVFGIPNLFNSCVSTGGAAACGPNFPATGAFPTPFQTALHALFEFYDLAILLIGVLIFLYYILIVVAETAQSGTPFGRRFNHIWAPLRLVAALGLLVPINYGLNSAQYIALYAAKLGSGFATNGWNTYIKGITDAGGTNLAGMNNPTNAPANTPTNAMVALPTAPQVDPIVEFMTLVRTCKLAYETVFPASGAGAANALTIFPWLVNPNPTNGQPDHLAATNGSWKDAVTYFNGGDVTISFGDYNQTKYPDKPGNVMPFCGQITIRAHEPAAENNSAGNGNAAAAAAANGAQGGADGPQTMDQDYYTWILLMWDRGVYTDFANLANCLFLNPKPAGAGCQDPPAPLPNDAWKQTQVQNETTLVQSYIQAAYNATLATTNFMATPDIIARGWGGAGIWYNKISQWNGALFGAVRDMPTITEMPLVMQQVSDANSAANQHLAAVNRYDPSLTDGKAIVYQYAGEDKIASVLNDVYKYWVKSQSTFNIGSKSIGNAFMDIANMLFGTQGLFDLRQNEAVNPLAQMAAMGKDITDAAIRNFMVSLAFSAGGGILNAMGEQTGAALAAVGSMFITMVTLGLTVGFILYYVLPFLPFIYFFFAMGGWVKAVFEAMVGTPLWALAHLRIDGDGLPPDTAMNGYFLIFDIFVRPIIITFSLLASFAVFTAMARTLNNIFSLVTENLTGFDCTTDCSRGIVRFGGDITLKRSVVDQFFFTIMYAIIMYMMATAAFKLIELIPNGVIRWMGAGVQTFNSHDEPDNLNRYAAIGAANTIGQVATGTSDLVQSIGGLSSRNSSLSTIINVTGTK